MAGQVLCIDSGIQHPLPLNAETQQQPPLPGHRRPAAQPLCYQGSGVCPLLFPESQESAPNHLLSQPQECGFSASSFLRPHRLSRQPSPPPRPRSQGSTAHSWWMFPRRPGWVGEHFLGPESANTQGSLKVTVPGRSKLLSLYLFPKGLLASCLPLLSSPREVVHPCILTEPPLSPPSMAESEHPRTKHQFFPSLAL